MRHLVRLTERVQARYPARLVVGHDPDLALATLDGHTDLGLAQGIAGPLALLVAMMRAGITVGWPG
ncbi:hypothetical protein AB0L13_45345 [Saccharopolyspora shandongensis]|uniref:hypothetical protein n=1 Tax=Saccharopolyspora shandongensis TaxID=418495 RepID=UPI00341A98F8